jgi:Stf0 sulfotransferase
VYCWPATCGSYAGTSTARPCRTGSPTKRTSGTIPENHPGRGVASLRGLRRYNFDGIERCRRLIENFELQGDRFFRANGVEPLVVAYEGLVEDREATVREVVRELRPDAPVPTNERTLERFARDRQRHPLADPLDLLPPGRWARTSPARPSGTGDAPDEALESDRQRCVRKPSG